MTATAAPVHDEVPFLDALAAARRVAESPAARVWGTDRSFFLVNGSARGNQAYLLAALGPAR